MSVHHGQGRRLFPLYAGMTLIPFLLHPLFLRPSNPISTCPYGSLLTYDFFSSCCFLRVPLVLECSAETQLLNCHGSAVWRDYPSHWQPLCTLQRGVHLFLWQGVTARDDISGLRIKTLSSRALSFSSFSFSVCTVDYLCLRIVLGTCPCEFCSFQTILWICQDHWNLNFIPLYVWRVFTPSHCKWKHLSICSCLSLSSSCRESL